MPSLGACETATPGGVSASERSYGCARLPRGARRERLESYLHDVVRPLYPLLPYDDVAAAWHATERARLDAAGFRPSFVDGQIAAIAASAGLILVTRNRKHFTGFRGVHLEDWSLSRRG